MYDTKMFKDRNISYEKIQDLSIDNYSNNDNYKSRIFSDSISNKYTKI